MRVVWASLWNTRAFDEREFANLDQTQVAMAILVHEAHEGEASQGVAISRNLMHVTRSDIYFIDAQIGVASVANPAPGVVTEQILYTWPTRTPEITYLSRSSLTAGADVLSLEAQRRVACAMRAVHEHFAPLLDPAAQDRLFAMQIEFKFERGTGDLVVKQARPQPFEGLDVPADCREID
jgi:phosphoenolpyruvate synthase/pyruvate phosphate dikinase